MFNVGDIIIGKKESENVYSVTTTKENFIGEVLRVYDEIRIKVKVISCNREEYIGWVYDVKSRHFELKWCNRRVAEKIKEKMGLK